MGLLLRGGMYRCLFWLGFYFHCLMVGVEYVDDWCVEQDLVKQLDDKQEPNTALQDVQINVQNFHD